jgi:hypothetical protein
MGRGVHSRTVSLTMTWNSRSRVTVPDWVLWSRRGPDIVHSSANGDVERGSIKIPEDTDESTANIPCTSSPGVTVAFEEVTGDVESVSVVTRRHSRGKNDSHPELVEVSDIFHT